MIVKTNPKLGEPGVLMEGNPSDHPLSPRFGSNFWKEEK
jgi:hypothetical protein